MELIPKEVIVNHILVYFGDDDLDHIKSINKTFNVLVRKYIIQSKSKFLEYLLRRDLVKEYEICSNGISWKDIHEIHSRYCKEERDPLIWACCCNSFKVVSYMVLKYKPFLRNKTFLKLHEWNEDLLKHLVTSRQEHNIELSNILFLLIFESKVDIQFIQNVLGWISYSESHITFTTTRTLAIIRTRDTDFVYGLLEKTNINLTDLYYCAIQTKKKDIFHFLIEKNIPPSDRDILKCIEYADCSESIYLQSIYKLLDDKQIRYWMNWCESSRYSRAHNLLLSMHYPYFQSCLLI